MRAGYEALREAVLAGRPDGWRHGHGVLAGRGMAAWIEAWRTVGQPGAGTPAAPSSPIQPPAEPGSDKLPASLSSLPDAGAVVTVLAEMALAHL